MHAMLFPLKCSLQFNSTHTHSLLSFIRPAFVSLQSGLVAMYHFGVVGGGPCGTAAVGALADNPEVSKIVWVDADNFCAGRMGMHYNDLPANTQNASLVDLAFGVCEAFNFLKTQAARDGAGGDSERPFSGRVGLSRFPRDICVDLAYLSDAVSDAAAELQRNCKVDAVCGVVESVVYVRDGEQGDKYRLHYSRSSADAAQTEAVWLDGVILATGARPSVPRCFAEEFRFRENSGERPGYPQARVALPEQSPIADDATSWPVVACREVRRTRRLCEVRAVASVFSSGTHHCCHQHWHGLQCWYSFWYCASLWALYVRWCENELV